MARSNLLPVAMDVNLPEDYWYRQETFPPSPVAARVARIGLLRDLYDGDIQAITPDVRVGNGVQDNLFAAVADFYESLIMSYPPVDERVPPELLAEFHVATSQVIVDLTRYGTGVYLASVDDDGEPHVEALYPGYWFPTGEPDSSVYFEPFTEYEAGKEDGDLYWRITVLRPGFNTVQIRKRDGLSSIGAVVDSVDFESLGRDQLVVCAMNPRVGVWGKSVYPDIAPHVAEIKRRKAQLSNILDVYADPMLWDGAGVSHVAKGLEAEQAADYEGSRLRSQRQRGNVIHSKDKPEYIQFDGNVAAQRSVIEDSTRAVFANSYIPEALYSLYPSSYKPISGEALRRAYAPAYLRSVQMIDELLACGNRVLGSLVAGVDLEWPNTLEVLDEDESGGTIEEGEAPDESGGEE